MDRSLKSMALRVLWINMAVSSVVAIIIGFFAGYRMGLVFLIGGIVSSLNFSLSAFVASYSVTGRISGLWGGLSTFARILAVALIGGLLFRMDRMYVLAYMGGFIMNFVALIIYSLKIKDERE
jgi:hypothetical protein